MKVFVTFVSLVVVLAGTGCQHDPASAAVSADSYLALPAGNDASRLDTADSYAREVTRLALAEEQLRRKSTRQLPSHLRRRRYQALKLLHAYRTTAQLAAPAGALLDAQGRPEALWYLLKHTGGEQALAQLREQPGPVRVTESQALRHWAQMSGLTVEECALIQGAE